MMDYPPNYARAEKLQTYVEKQIDRIADIVEETEKNLSDKGFGYFKSELGDFFNEV